MSSYSDYADAVGRIEQNRGNAAAQAAQNTGAIWGNTIANIGQIVGSIPQQRAELEKVKLAAEEMQMRRDRAATEAAQAKSEAEKEQQLSALWNAPDPPPPSAILRIDSGARGRDMVKLLESFQAHPQTPIEQQENIGKMLKYFPALPEQDKAAAWTTLRPVLVSVSGDQSVPEQYDPNWVTMRVGAAPPTVAKTRTVTVTNADGSKTEKIVEDVPGQEFESAAPTAHQPTSGNMNEIELIRAAGTGDPQAIKDLATYRAMHPPSQSGSGAGAKKEKSVTSGDANKISDINTGLFDLNQLRGAIDGVKDATGVKAQVGAQIPSWVTSITGWGVEAKQKQALIDLVKQIIGKSLEGGVLRKEDEVKYKKILPQLADHPDVVKAKLNGLDAAVQRKREELFSSLDDAGYDVSAFRARQANAPNAAPVDPRIGQTVTVGGKRYKVKAINPATGMADLEPLP